MLHWNQEDTFNAADTFDVIVASDWYDFLLEFSTILFEAFMPLSLVEHLICSSSDIAVCL